MQEMQNVREKNERLQKWAEDKTEVFIKWMEEYDSICREEGITDNSIVNVCFDRNYFSGIQIFYHDSYDNLTDYMVNTDFINKESANETEDN